MNAAVELVDRCIEAGRDAIAIGEEIAARLEVYKSLCKSQQQALEAYERTIDEIEWLCEGRVDIDNNGGPNLAMQIMQAIRGDDK